MRLLSSLLLSAAILSSTVHTQSTSPAYVQIWTGSSSCGGAPSAAQTVVPDGRTCTTVNPGSATVTCNSDNSWSVTAYLNSDCGGNSALYAAGTSPNQCKQVRVLGLSASLQVDCTDQGKDTAATTSPATAAAVVPATTAPTTTPSINSKCYNAVPYAGLPLGYCAQFYAKNVTAPRGMIYDTSINAVITVEQSTSYIIALIDSNNNGYIDESTDERIYLSQNKSLGLNHGIAYNAGYLFASSAASVYRWPYSSSNLTMTSSSDATTVITGIPTGGHSTRTIKFSPDNQYMYIGVGSASNVDPSIIYNRQQIKRYNVSDLLSINDTSSALDYSTTGELFAQGLRNEAALGFDPYGNLVGGMNGNDNLYRSDLGGDIHQNNPAEEIDIFLEANAGAFYGYPYCWSEWNLPSNVSNGTGLQWAMPYDQGTPYQYGTYAALAIAGTVPNFYSVPPALTEFTFQGLNGTVQPGQIIDLATTQTTITNVSFPTNQTDYYAFLIYDPDASARWNPNLAPYAHCIVVNIPGNNVSLEAGTTVFPFQSPAPPAGTGYHRYTNVVYKQNSGQWTIEDLSQYNNSARPEFNYTAFLDQYSGSDGLTLVSGNLFLTQNETDEPTPSISNYTMVNDAYCRNSSAVIPPRFVLPPHTAPLGLVFYNGSGAYEFPDQSGQLYVTSHGSWDRKSPIGYRLWHINVTYTNTTTANNTLSNTLFTNTTSSTTEQYGNFTSYESFFYYANEYGADTDSQAWPYRPVDVIIGLQGEMYVSSDETNDIIVIKYIGGDFNQSAQSITNATLFDQSVNYTFANSSGINGNAYNGYSSGNETVASYNKLRAIINSVV